MTSPARTTRKPSKIWMVAIPVAVTVAVLGLWTFTRGAKPTGKPIPAAARTASSAALEKIAVQQADLPRTFRKCSFSGDFLTHNEAFRGVNDNAYRTNLALWNTLKSQGATAAYIAYWGDSAAACDTVVGGPQAMQPHDPGAAHPSVAFSVVVSFVNEEDAASSYQADTFKQSSLRKSAEFELKDGDATGLGPNSLSASQPKAVVPVHQAIWQSRAVEVLFGSENLTLTESEAVTAAINRRIG